MSKNTTISGALSPILLLSFAVLFARCDGTVAPPLEESDPTVSLESPSSEADGATALERKQRALNSIAVGKNNRVTDITQGNSTYSNLPGAINVAWNGMEVPGHSGLLYKDFAYTGNGDNYDLVKIAELSMGNLRNEVKNAQTTVSSGALIWQSAGIFATETFDILADADFEFERNTSIGHLWNGEPHSHNIRGGKEPGIFIFSECGRTDHDADQDQDKSCNASAANYQMIPFDFGVVNYDFTCGQGKHIKVRYQVQYGELGMCNSVGLGGSQSLIDVVDHDFQVFKRGGNTSANAPSGVKFDGYTLNIDTPAGGVDDFEPIGSNVDVTATENIFVWKFNGSSFVKINSTASTSVSFAAGTGGSGVVVSASGEKFIRFKYVNI